MTDGAMQFSYEDRSFQNLIRDLKHRVGSAGPAMEIIGETLQTSVQRNFEEGGRPTRWTELKPSTIEQRKKKGKWPGQLLVVEGTRGGLMGSINYEATDSSVVFFANKPYAAIHHYGGQAGPGRKVTIPARPYMMIQDEDWNEIKTALTEFLIEGKS